MLTYFSVKGFKNFKDEIVLDLGNTRDYQFNAQCIKNGAIRAAMMYGPNSSGKSNFGEALFDIVSSLTDKNKEPRLYANYLNLDVNASFAEFCYKFKFQNDEVKYCCKKQNQDTFLEETVIINGSVAVKYDYIKNKGKTTLPDAEKLNLNLFNNNISFAKYIYKNTNLDKRKADSKAFCDLFNFVERMLFFRSLDTNAYIGFTNGSEQLANGIIDAGKLNDFEVFLRQNKIEYTFKEDPNTKNIMCVFDGGKAVNLFEIASNGTKALSLFYYWYVRLNKASFVFVDEFDAFYHSDISENIVKALIAAENIQFMLTTHNTDIMTSELLRPDCYFLLNNGTLKSISDSTEKELRIAHNLQKMYKGGAFERADEK